MLAIRQAQMEQLAQLQQKPVALKMGLTLKERYPQIFQHYSDTQMQAWVTRQLNYLKSHNITGQKATTDIIELLAIAGERFERCAQNDWALEIIEDKERNEGIRALKLQRKAEAYFQSVLQD